MNKLKNEQNEQSVFGFVFLVRSYKNSLPGLKFYSVRKANVSKKSFEMRETLLKPFNNKKP